MSNPTEMAEKVKALDAEFKNMSDADLYTLYTEYITLQDTGILPLDAKTREWVQRYVDAGFWPSNARNVIDSAVLWLCAERWANNLTLRQYMESKSNR